MLSLKLDFLAVGNTTISAALDYNGKKYTDEFKIAITEKACNLNLSSSKYPQLPKEILAGSEFHLEVMEICGVLPSKNVTKDVTWTSNNEKVATVNDGKVKAISPGKVIITASYKNQDYDELNTKNYELEVKEINNDDNPKTGAFVSIMIINLLIILMIIIILLQRKNKILSI